MKQKITISVTPEMKEKLDEVKKRYFKESQNAMLEDLILVGLSTLEKKYINKEEKQK